MHPIDQYTTIKRRQEELQRRAEYEKMVRAARLKRRTHQCVHREVANWLGMHLVRWGQKLEQFGMHKPLQPSRPPSGQL
jgi:hypothetical protein